MCEQMPDCTSSADEELAKVLNRYFYLGWPHNHEINAARVRKLISEKWSVIAALAHKIHDEETSAKRLKEARERAELARLKAIYERC